MLRGRQVMGRQSWPLLSHLHVERPGAARVGYETVTLADPLVVPEPLAVIDADGALRYGTMPTRITAPGPALAAATLPIAAGTTVALGAFLGEALSVAGSGCAGRRGWLIGAPLTPPQIDALAILGLLGDYRPILQPTPVETASFVRATQHGSRMVRPAIEALRFVVEPYETSSRIAILAPDGAGRFAVENRASLLAWLRASGFAVLDVAAMRLETVELGLTDLIAALAACQTVIINDPDQALLLGFCDPGTCVLELGIDGWFDGAVANAAQLFGLEWRLHSGATPHYPLNRRLPLGARRMLRTEIDISGLDSALSAMRG